MLEFLENSPKHQGKIGFSQLKTMGK